jgi:mRNA-degrading endonuclease RelE of RelBE toxin-antitoxin system
VPYDIRFHDDAVADLERIRTKSGAAHARLVSFMREFLADEDGRHYLAVEGHQDGILNIVGLKEWKRAGYDVMRIKLMGVDVRFGKEKQYLNHRFVYAFDDRNGIVWILGIFHRSEFDYSLSGRHGKRIARAYDELNLPRQSIH